MKTELREPDFQKEKKREIPIETVKSLGTLKLAWGQPSNLSSSEVFFPIVGIYL